jgi:biotin operon repressor
MKKEAKKEVKEEAKKEVKKEEAKKEEAKKEEAKKEEVKLEILEVPDACDAVAEGFKNKTKVGFFDPNSVDCKECKDVYPKAYEACVHNTEAEKLLALKPKEKKKDLRERTPLGGYVDSGAGKMELLLLRKEGATMEEMKACRKAVASHLRSLKLRGFTIVKIKDRYFANPSKEILEKAEKSK